AWGKRRGRANQQTMRVSVGVQSQFEARRFKAQLGEFDVFIAGERSQPGGVLKGGEEFCNYGGISRQLAFFTEEKQMRIRICFDFAQCDFALRRSENDGAH